MAARRSSCAGGCLVKTLIAIVIVIALIVGAFIWAINQTPARFGLADYEIQGMTIREMGFADMKIKDIAKLFKSLLKPDESAIMDNPYDAEDKANADSKAGAMGLPEEDGQPDYLSLMGETPVTTATPQLLTFADTEIAYILNSIVTQASSQAEGEEEAQVIRDMNASIAQVTITKGTETTLEILLKIDISSIKGDMPAIAANRLPDVVYLNSINKLTVSEGIYPLGGIISTESSSIEINGMDGATTNILINAISSGIEEAQQAEDPSKYFNDTFGAFFIKVVNNMGLVGASVTNCGPDGVINHGIKVVTRILPL